MGKSDLLIIDEADYILLDEASPLPMERFGVIALSATNWNDDKSYEKGYIVNKLKFKVYVSLSKKRARSFQTEQTQVT